MMHTEQPIQNGRTQVARYIVGLHYMMVPLAVPREPWRGDGNHEIEEFRKLFE